MQNAKGKMQTLYLRTHGVNVVAPFTSPLPARPICILPFAFCIAPHT